MRINGGLVLIIGLPLLAIAASVGTATVAFLRGDPTLPDEYHWEGMKLDRDFSDSQRAFDLNVQAVLHISPAMGTCRVTLRMDAAPPPVIDLTFIHGTRPDLDRHVQLTQRGGGYEAPCGPMPEGHWHVELRDAAGTWSVREDVVGTLENANITAHAHSG
jgi:hypothetical protein